MNKFELPVLFRSRVKLNLQRFAGDDGAGDPAGNGGQGADPNSNPNPPADPPKPSGINFASQADLDAHVQEVLNSAKAQWEKDSQTQKDYEDMTPAEKQKYDLEQAQNQLAETQRQNTILQNRAAMTTRLATDELPATLVEIFGGILGEDQKTIDASYETVAATFRDAVKSAVETRLASSAGKPGASGAGAGNEESAGLTAAKARNSQNQGAKNSWATKV